MSGIFIIAEAGVNHNGSLETAKRLIDAAASSGADAVKFQTFRAEKLASRSAAKVQYQIKNTGSDETQMEMLKSLELSYEDFRQLEKYCGERGILFLSTPFEEESAAFLIAELKMPLVKIPSGEVTNLPFLEFIAGWRRPVILSTGMSTLAEVADAVHALSKKLSKRSITLLHCTTSYPCAMEDVNLLAMKTLEETFGVHVGYSDHTLGIEVAIAAAALGARVIEKHLTLNKEMHGPDHRASLEPAEFKAMVRAIRMIEKALGDGEKKPTAGELALRPLVRKSIVPARNLKAGTRIEQGDVTVKRAGDGISPARMHEILGKTLAQDKAQDELLEWSDLQS